MQSAVWKDDLGPGLERVAARVEPGRHVPLTGDLPTQPLTPGVLETLEMPPGACRRDVYALRVRGSSLTEDGILDGDRILVDPSQPVRAGQTIVAEVDGHVSVKRWYPEADGRVRLQPANDRVLPLVVRSERVRIVGVLLGVLRKRGFAARNAASTSSSPPRHATRVRPTDGRTLDLALRIVQHNLVEWERLVRTNVVAAQRWRTETKTLAQSLRALYVTYAATESPRLRKALLDEAGRISRRMRAVAARLGWDPSEIRPLAL